jgi:hypothetical protein
MMFAAANFLAYSCRLRMVWFPDINHVESNAEKAVFMASGLSQVNEKVSVLARLPYGPRKDAGHWLSQMQQAFEALAPPSFYTTNNHFSPIASQTSCVYSTFPPLFNLTQHFAASARHQQFRISLFVFHIPGWEQVQFILQTH